MAELEQTTHKAKILVVDDEPPLLFALARLMKSAGYAVIEAATGEAGWKMAKEHRPDLILLDLALPDTHGLEICRRIKADPALHDCYVVLLTGTYVTSENQALGLEAGAEGYITRPIPNRELLARVKTLLQIQQVEKAMRQTNQELSETNRQLQREIDERIRVETALRESEARYRLLFNSSHDAIFVHLLRPDGMPGKFVEVNDIACQRLGYTRQEFMTMSPMDIDDPGFAAVRPAVKEKLAANKHVLFEMVHIAKDGTKVPVEINAHIFEFDGQSMVLSVARDVTQRRKMESQLRDYTDRLEHLIAQKVKELDQERAKVIQAGKLAALGEMATGVAHELNQPLTAMLFDADYLKQISRQCARPAVDPAIRAEELHKIGMSLSQDIERCRRIIDHLRAFGRVSEGYVSPINLNQSVKDVLILTRERLRQHGVRVELQLAPQLPPIMGDAHKLEQVFLNLISNAEYALAQQAETRPASTYQKILEITTYCEGKWVVAKIYDNGIGIPSEAQEHIFEPFFTTKPVGEGTGLGMSISYGIVTELEGEITFQSAEHEGTTFELRFPIVTIDDGCRGGV